MLSLLLGAIGGGLLLYGLWGQSAAIGSTLLASIGGGLLLYGLWGHSAAIGSALSAAIGGGLLLYGLWDYTAAIGSVLWASIGGAVLLLVSIGLILLLYTLWIHMGAIRTVLLASIGGGLLLYTLWDYTAAIGSVLWASIGGAVLLLASIGAILLLYNLWGHMGAIRTMLLGSIGGGLLLYTLWDYTAAIGSVLLASIGGAVLLLASIGLSLSLCTLWIHMGAIRTALLASIGGGLLLYTLWDYTAAIGSVLWASIWGAVLLLASIGLILSLCTLWIPYLYADLKAFLTLLSSSLRSRWRLSRRPPLTLLRRFLYHAGRRPQHPMLLYRDQLFTYRDMDLWSNRAARSFALQLGCNGGGCVAVFLPNVPVYVCTWLALAKLGCAMACINCNLKGRALLHAIRAAGPAAVLSCNDLHVAIEEVLPALQQDGLRVFYLDPTSPTPGVPALQPHIESCSDDPVPDRYRTGTTGSSKAVYIYTSGTTGLPKAAVITEMKVLLVASLAQMCGLRGDDVVLTTLPLYHSAGLLIGVGGCIEVGATCVLRSKFSASQFWADCRKYNVTVIQYVGELLRYLCNTPKSPSDRDHNVRLAIGNGLRGNVWSEFLQRFGPIEISEFYGATEGNAGFINYTGKVGAVGRANVFLKVFSSFELIQYDVEQDEPVRNKDGFCIRVRPGETGLLVIRITRNTPFHGYAGDKSRTEKKILRDVFDKGDSYFNSGDLLMMDHERFLYFQDRVGDTFRWKGENVATTEVEAALSMVDFIQEVNVYGVAVPGCEGKCGMAAVRLKPGHEFNGEKIYGAMSDSLPQYAAPRFIRVQDAIEVTGTFKQCKLNLVSQGFDPALVPDPLYVRHDTSRSYLPLDEQRYGDILRGNVSL